jgi:hypothetical protein
LEIKLTEEIGNGTIMKPGLEKEAVIITGIMKIITAR